MSVWTFILNHLDLNIHATIKKITLWNMQGSIPQQKFYFCHLPTRGRVGIKLGDDWHVSNVYIIFDCSMLLYYPFWMFMGFTLHFYIIFGTILLTGGPVCIAVFLSISVFWRKGISNGVQTEWNLREQFFGTNVIQRTWSGSQETTKAATRVEDAPPYWASPPICGPLGRPPTYFFLLYKPTCPENIQGATEGIFPPL